MSIETILVAASGGSASDGAVTLAGRLAQRFGAHLEVFHAHGDPREAAIALGDGFAAPVAVDLIERATEEIGAAAGRAKRQFEGAARQFDLKMCDTPPRSEANVATIRWHEETGYAPDLIARRVRLFDLAVLGRSERVVDEPHTDALEQTLLHCGQPVLIAPAKVPALLGESIAVAWNGSAEAARAVSGALPFLHEAKLVRIFTAGHVDAGEGDALAEALAWRGIALRWVRFWEILRVGLMSSLGSLSVNITVIGVTGLVGTFGTAALAGYGIGSRLEYMQIPLIFGFGAALVAMVGTNIGAGRMDRALRVAWIGASLAGAITLTIGALVALWPVAWAGLFSTDPEVLAAAMGYLRIVGPAYGFLGFGLALYFASQGAGLMLWPVASGLFRMVLAVGGSWVAVSLLGFGLHGIFAMLAIAMTLFAPFNALPIRFGSWAGGR